MRYFLEVAYKGTNYSGFQIQKNANSVQGEVEKALATVLRSPIETTGSSRTDAGVHAYQNFFHFDFPLDLKQSILYNLNSVLPDDIVVKSITLVSDKAHCRFDATSRMYKYHVSFVKDPFKTDTAWFYPYKIDSDLLKTAAGILFKYTNYMSFSKRNTKVFTYECSIKQSNWVGNSESLTYTVEANRFLRGMVRGLVGTMLLVGRKKISLSQFESIIQAQDCTKANFATPAHGLVLLQVNF